MRVRPIALLLLVIALVAAGCGGDSESDSKSSKQDYGNALAQAGQTLQKTFADIADQQGASTSSAEIGQRLERGATALDDAATKFGKITPPKDAASAHKKLVEGLQELADVFRKGGDAARKNDTKTLSTALQGLTNSDGVKKITEAQEELKKLGVTVTTASSSK